MISGRSRRRLYAAGSLLVATVGAAAAAPSAFAASSASTSPEWSGVTTSPIDTAVRLAPTSETNAVATRTITVDTTQRFQTWRGVGASLTDASTTLLAGRGDAQAMLFDTTDPTGSHLNLLRLPLSATDFSTEYWTWSWSSRRQRATPPTPALDAIELATTLDGVATDLSVIATPWTAPARMKTTRRIEGGTLRGRQTDDYAALLAAQSDYLLAAGLPLQAITIVNEPGHSSDYPTMTMTNAQLLDVAAVLAPRLDADGVELWALDHNFDDATRVDELVAGAPGTWDAAAFHCYAGSPDQMAASPIGSIVTECTGTTDTWANTFAWDAENLVVGAAEAGSTGLMMWNLALDPDHGPKADAGCDTCRGLLTIDPTTGTIDPTPEFYTLAHVARAAQPGAERVAASYPADVIASAFVQPDGSVGVFGHNDTDAEQIVAIVVDGVDHRFAVPAGAMFTVAGALPDPLPAADGDIAVDSAGERWFVAATANGLVRQQILSQQTFVCDLARGGNTIALSDAELAGIPIDGDRAGGDCILRAPEGDAHVVDTGGLRQWIPDGGTWTCEIDRGLEVINTTRQYIDAIPEGDWRICIP